MFKLEGSNFQFALLALIVLTATRTQQSSQGSVIESTFTRAPER